MRLLTIILALVFLTGCINRRYPPGVAADPHNVLKLSTAEDSAALNRELTNAALTPK